jgi:hypothetical protein
VTPTHKLIKTPKQLHHLSPIILPASHIPTTSYASAMTALHRLHEAHTPPLLCMLGIRGGWRRRHSQSMLHLHKSLTLAPPFDLTTFSPMSLHFCVILPPSNSPPPPSPPSVSHFLLQPRWPYCMGGRKNAPPLFYGTYKPLGIITAAITGLQHALAMAAGLVTPPLLVGQLSPDPETRTCEGGIHGATRSCVHAWIAA